MIFKRKMYRRETSKVSPLSGGCVARKNKGFTAINEKKKKELETKRVMKSCTDSPYLCDDEWGANYSWPLSADHTVLPHCSQATCEASLTSRLSRCWQSSRAPRFSSN